MTEPTFLSELFKPFHGAQRNTLTAIVDAICRCGGARSMDIATQLMATTGVLIVSGMNRLYRLLRNPRIDWWKLTTREFELLVPTGQRAVVAVDWTEWHSGLRLLVAGLVYDHRAVPVAAVGTTQTCTVGSQNSVENRFLRQLDAAAEAADRRVVAVFDRGFLRTSLFRLLMEDTSLDFVIRVAEKRRVWRTSSKTLRLDQAGLYPGQMLDLGVVTVVSGRGGRAKVRVVGVWACGQREPWWLATSLLDDSVEELVRLYYARMGVEEMFRDQKGCRFGTALEWTRFRDVTHLERMIRLVGIALVMFSSAGYLMSLRRPSLRMPCKRKGPRLSYVGLGRRLMQAQCADALRLAASAVRVCFPPPKPPAFSWLWKRASLAPAWEVQK